MLSEREFTANIIIIVNIWMLKDQECRNWHFLFSRRLLRLILYVEYDGSFLMLVYQDVGGLFRLVSDSLFSALLLTNIVSILHFNRDLQGDSLSAVLTFRRM